MDKKINKFNTLTYSKYTFKYTWLRRMQHVGVSPLDTMDLAIIYISFVVPFPFLELNYCNLFRTRSVPSGMMVW